MDTPAGNDRDAVDLYGVTERNGSKKTSWRLEIMRLSGGSLRVALLSRRRLEVFDTRCRLFRLSYFERRELPAPFFLTKYMMLQVFFIPRSRKASDSVFVNDNRPIMPANFTAVM